MATRIQFRRGTTAQHASFTGATGEVTVNTDKEVVVVHDGSTAGGFEMIRSDLTNIDIDGTESAGKVIQADGDGTYSWGTGFNAISDTGILLDTAGGEGPAGPSSNGLNERYGQMEIFNSSNLNMRQTSNGNQVITIQESGKYFIKVAGAKGGGAQGGNGGIAWGTISLTAGDVLYCRVGQRGLNGGQSTTSTTPLSDPSATNLSPDNTGSNNMPGGGFGDGFGGRGGGPSSGNTCSGGGGTAVRLNTDSVANRIIVAGGGGGAYTEGTRFQTGPKPDAGGADGGGYYGLTADVFPEGSGSRTGGGTQTGGGYTGSGGSTGTQTQGGNGPTNDGGGGGGGYWGGSSATNSSGGGGSGYVGGMDSSNRGMSSGGNSGHGWIFIQKVG